MVRRIKNIVFGGDRMDNKKVTVKKYSNDDITVFWYPEKCTHATTCWRELGQVFKPKERPWVDVNAATGEEIIKTVDKCPSGALKYLIPEGSSIDSEDYRGKGWVNYESTKGEVTKITMVENGPLIVEGLTRICDSSGTIIKESDSLVLCRCGKTENIPFCDGSHTDARR